MVLVRVGVDDDVVVAAAVVVIVPLIVAIHAAEKSAAAAFVASDAYVVASVAAALARAAASEIVSPFVHASPAPNGLAQRLKSATQPPLEYIETSVSTSMQASASV